MVNFLRFQTTGAPHPARLRRAFNAAILLFPLVCLSTRAGADILIAIVCVIFLYRCASLRDWRWLRQPWVVAAGVWWAWMVVTSLPDAHAPGWSALVQALAMGRFFIFTAALAERLPADPATARRLGLAIALASAWIGLQCWQQYLTGANIFGWPRWSDGELTGPFRQPTAGPQLVLLLFPGMIPLVMALLRRRGIGGQVLAGLVAVAGLSTMILIGQRMPVLLTGLGVVCCAVFLRRMRPVLLLAVVVAALVLAATPVISPPTYAKLVRHFTQQMSHFRDSQYGLLFARATILTLDRPATGFGFDGFRHNCADPALLHAAPALGITAAQATDPLGCNIHPHNHYLEAATDGGIPGLVLFCILVVVWLTRLGTGLFARPDPMRVGTFTAFVIAFWPLASTSALFTIPNAGWIFLLAGYGFALANPALAGEANP